MAITDKTSRMKWSIPQEGASPWYPKFQSLMAEIDAAVYATREDRNMLLTGGGTTSWNSGTGVLSWTEDFVLTAPVTGFRWNVTASSVTLQDGYLIYATVTRAPSTNKIVTGQVAQRVPTEPSGNDQILIGMRVGTFIIFRNGFVLATGDSTVNFQPPVGFTAAGDLSGDATSQTVVGIQGRDVTATAPTTGQVYKWNGSAWAPSADAAGTMPTFVFRPGGSASGNVYTDWANLMSTLGTIEGSAWIELDDSLGTVTIPSGTHDLEGRAHLVSKGSTGRTVVYLDSGSILRNAASFNRLAFDALVTTTGKIDWSAGGSCRIYDCDFTTHSSANALIIPPLPNTLWMVDSTFTSQGAAFPVLAPTAGGSQAIYLEGYSSIPDDCLGGTETIDVYLQTGWNTCSTTQTAHSGTLNVYSQTSAAVQTTFVFRPGGVASGNVYTSWSNLMTALGSVEGPKVIELDASLDSNNRCDIPAGTWDLGGSTVLRGLPYPTGGATTPSKVAVADGGVLRNALVLEGHMHIYSASTGAIFDWSGHARRLVLKGSVRIFGDALAGVPARSSHLIVANTSAVHIELYENSGLFAEWNSTYAVLRAEAGADCVVEAFDRALLKSYAGTLGKPFSTDGVGATILTKIYSEAVGYYVFDYVGISYNTYVVRQLVVDLCRAPVTNAYITPTSCGAGYVSYKSIPKHAAIKCQFRAILESSSGTAGYEAYIDLFDVYGRLNAGTPQPVPGSEMSTDTGGVPVGAPTPNTLLPGLYYKDLTSAIVGGTWVGDIAILEPRVWIGTEGGGHAATCKSAELIFTWTEQIYTELEV